MTVKKQKAKLYPLSKLKPYPHNVKEHPREQLNDLKRLIQDKKIGYTYPIIIDEKDQILAGHGRVQAMSELGEKQIPAIKLEGLTKSEKHKLVIRDNYIAESPWITENVQILLQEMKPIDIEPFEMKLEQFEPEPELKEETEPVPEPPKKPKAKLGAIYQLGNHRVMCGSCLEAEDVQTLLNSRKVDQLLTDPPYGVDYSNKNKYLNSIGNGNRIETPIQNDAIKDYKTFFKAFLDKIHFAKYNTIYVFLSGKHTLDLELAFNELKINWTTWLIWKKNNHVLGRMDYSTMHEPILYGWKGTHKFYGGFRRSVLEYDKPQSSDLHPTMKPINLLAQLIQDGTKKNMLVYDPFLGSGSTLIACEQTNRICYGMELDPAYIDVIIERWENYTGKKAIKITS